MIAETLEAYAAQQHKEFTHDRTQTVGASEIGYCARKTYFAKNHGDPFYGRERDREFDAESGWGPRVRGSVFEAEWWVPAMRQRYGELLLYSGDRQRSFVHGFLSATPDGLLLGNGADSDSGSILLDCKSIDPRVQLTEAKPEHVYQVQVGMGLVRLLTNHKPNRAIISYTNASFWDDTKEYEVAYDEEVFQAAQERARQIMTAKAPADIKPEGRLAGGKECLRCPFRMACGIVQFESVVDVAEQVDDETALRITAQARFAKLLRAEAERNIEDAKRTEGEVKEMLKEAGTRKIQAGNVSVAWSAVRGRHTWDDKAIRDTAVRAGIDLSPYQKIGEPSDRLTITIRGEP